MTRKIIFFTIILFSRNIIFATNNLDGNKILKKSEIVSTPKTQKVTYTQTVYYPSGSSRKFKVVSYSINKGKKLVIEYLLPSRVRGDKFLFLENGGIWAYFSKTGRKRRIVSSLKKSRMQGSDFSYEDTSIGIDITKKFFAKLIEEKNDEYILKLIPKKDDISYNKLILHIDKNTFATKQMLFYENNSLKKEMTYLNFTTIKGYIIAKKMIMKSMNRGSKTIINLKKCKIDIPIDENIFDWRKW